MRKTSVIAKIFLLLFMTAMVCICFGCEKEVEFVPIPQRPVPDDYMLDKEREMILITNQHRQALGLHSYKTSLDLYHLAKGRVYYMAERDSLSHDGFYPAYLESGALFYGESISYNFITAQGNMAGFQSSANHWPMFISVVYEYIAIACFENYTVVLVARWRPYRADGKIKIEETKISTQKISTKIISKR